jgi:hypothetical protein
MFIRVHHYNVVSEHSIDSLDLGFVVSKTGSKKVVIYWILTFADFGEPLNPQK